MSGTRAGGKKGGLKIKEIYGDDFYNRIGQIGGRVKGLKKGFAANPELAKAAGAKGGRISRRGKSKWL